MKQHHIDEKQVSVIRYKAIIIYQTLPYSTKNKQKSVYGGGGIWNISNNTTRCDILIC